MASTSNTTNQDSFSDEDYENVIDDDRIDDDRLTDLLLVAF